MFKNELKTWFDWIWWLGFLIAVGAAILLTTNETFRQGIIENKSIVLLYGIGHMIILSIIGMLAIQNRANNLDIGSRISTMGYLHTLIGTSVALILVSNNTSSTSENILNQVGNPSSTHSCGLTLRGKIDQARQIVGEICNTSSGKRYIFCFNRYACAFYESSDDRQ